MMSRLSISMVLCVSVVFLAILVGCGRLVQTPTGESPSADGGGEPDEYNPHDVPISEERKDQLRQETSQFADAVVRIRELRIAIEEETTGGIPENPYQAHQALDKVDLVLQWLPEITRESGVAREHWEAVNLAANQLRELFEQVHLNIDNKQDPDFAGIATQVDQSIAGLEAIPQ